MCGCRTVPCTGVGGKWDLRAWVREEKTASLGKGFRALYSSGKTTFPLRQCSGTLEESLLEEVLPDRACGWDTGVDVRGASCLGKQGKKMEGEG